MLGAPDIGVPGCMAVMVVIGRLAVLALLVSDKMLPEQSGANANLPKQPKTFLVSRHGIGCGIHLDGFDNKLFTAAPLIPP